ncbi:MAG: hypothetical protein ABEH43_00130 [Flavobacteriales bacterium]
MGFYKTTYPQLLDSISNSLEHKPNITAKFDSRFTFITSRSVKIVGAKVGLEYNHNFQWGIGFNTLFDGFSTKKKINGNKKTVNFQSTYWSPYAEYRFYKSKHWEFSMPVQLDIGKQSLQYEDNNDNKKKYNEGVIFGFEPAMTFQYKFWEYFGLGAGVGYRIMFLRNKAVNKDFFVPIYMFRFKLFFGDLVKDVF